MWLVRLAMIASFVPTGLVARAQDVPSQSVGRVFVVPPPVHEWPEVAAGIRLEDVVASPEVYAQYFELFGEQHWDLDAGHLAVEMHVRIGRARYEEDLNVLYKVDYAGKSLWIPAFVGALYWNGNQIHFAEKPFNHVQLANPTGGNCINCSGWIVVGLISGETPKILGEISHICRLGNSGWQEYPPGLASKVGATLENDMPRFFEVADVFEYTPLTCHADGAVEWVQYRLTEEGFVPDMTASRRLWTMTLETMDQELATRIQQSTRERRDDPAISVALHRLLCHLLLDEAETGWSKLRKDFKQISKEGRLHSVYAGPPDGITVDEAFAIIREYVTDSSGQVPGLRFSWQKEPQQDGP